MPFSGLDARYEDSMCFGEVTLRHRLSKTQNEVPAPFRDPPAIYIKSEYLIAAEKYVFKGKRIDEKNGEIADSRDTL